MPARRLLVTLSLALLAGCGSSTQPMDPQVRTELLARVAQIRAAATRHDRAAAEAALRALSSDVSTARAQGRLDQAYATSIMAAADRVAEDVRTIAIPVPPTVAPAPRETSQPHSEPPSKDKGKHGKGN